MEKYANVFDLYIFPKKHIRMKKNGVISYLPRRKKFSMNRLDNFNYYYHDLRTENLFYICIENGWW